MVPKDKSARQQRIAHLSVVHTVGELRIYQKECRSLWDAGYDVFMVGVGETPQESLQPRIIGVPPGKNRLERVILTTAAAVSAGLKSHAAVFHLHDIELIPWGVFLKAIGKKVIFDNHEFAVQDVRDKPYIPKPLRSIAAAATSLVLAVADRCFDGIVVAAPAMLRDFKNPETVVINNYVEWDLPSEHSVAFSARRSAVAYIGMISEDRGIRMILEALELVNRTTPVELILAGEFEAPALYNELQQNSGWRYVDYRGLIARSEIRSILAADVVAGLIIFRDLENHRNASPNKLFEYLASGLPVIMPDFPSWVERFSGTGACIPVDVRDTGSIAAAIESLVQDTARAEDMGRHAFQAVKTSFHWNSERQKLLALYARIIGEPKHAEALRAKTESAEALRS